VSNDETRALRFGLLAIVSIAAGVSIEVIALRGAGSGLFALAGLAGYAFFAGRSMKFWRNGACTCLHGPRCWCQAGPGESREHKKVVTFPALRRSGARVS